MAKYACKGKGCGFSTDDLEEFVRHLVGHRQEASAPKGTHRSAREYLECPQCKPKFEKALVERGWKSPEEAKAAKKERQSAL